MPPDVERSMLAHRQLGLDFVYKYKLKHAEFDLRADGVEGDSGNGTASDADAGDSGSSGSDDDTGRQGERADGAENESVAETSDEGLEPEERAAGGRLLRRPVQENQFRGRRATVPADVVLGDDDGAQQGFEGTVVWSGEAPASSELPPGWTRPLRLPVQDITWAAAVGDATLNRQLDELDSDVSAPRPWGTVRPAGPAPGGRYCHHGIWIQGRDAQFRRREIFLWGSERGWQSVLHRPRQDACQLELGRAVAGSFGADAAAAGRLRRLAALGRRRLLELSAVWMLPTTKKGRTVVELATALLGAQGGEMTVEQLQGGPN